MCHVCNKLYSQSATLSRHLKKTHNFKWPSGHDKFRYKLDPDGYYRLQTLRYESVELFQQELNSSKAQSQETQPELENNSTESILNHNEANTESQSNQTESIIDPQHQQQHQMNINENAVIFTTDSNQQFYYEVVPTTAAVATAQQQIEHQQQQYFEQHEQFHPIINTNFIQLEFYPATSSSSNTAPTESSSIIVDPIHNQNVFILDTDRSAPHRLIF
jgi:hypothetical protein